MKKVILFIAMSLDGYIADKEGDVDWLAGQEPGQDDMVSYDEFIKGISTIVIGWNTYHQLITELSPGKWFYSGLKSYVLTHRNLPSTEEIEFVDEDVCELVRNLKKSSEEDIWICGGAAVIRPLVEADLIDRYHISVIPTILKGGIRLFEGNEGEGSEIKLKLVDTKMYNGIVDLVYERRAESPDSFH